MIRTSGASAACLLLLILIGCQNPSGPLQPSGWFRVRNGTERHAADAIRFFETVRQCADAASAEPRDVEVIIVADELHDLSRGGGFACPEGGLRGMIVGGCMDDHLRRMYVLDWTLHPWWSESFGHESIHLARRIVSGNPDAGHDGPWWVTDKKTGQPGRACQAGLQ